ncbi:tetratricopeptide repeat protein [Sphingomonas koreensis]
MKSVSKAALAAAFAMSAPALLAASPALAQKKKEEAGPQIKVGEPFRKVAGEVETLIKAKDWAGAQPKLAGLDSVAQSDGEKYYAAVFRLQVTSGLNDIPGTMTAIDALLVNPNTPPADIGRYSFFRGNYAYQQKKYAEAIALLTKSRQLGYVPSGTNLDLRIAQAQLDGGQIPQGVVSIDAAIKAEEAAGRKAPESWYKVVVSKLYTSGDKAGATTWLNRQLAAHPTSEAWRQSLLVYLEQLQDKGVMLDPDQRLDVLRLMRASKAMGGESDYFQYADVAQRRGLPGEVKSVIDEGRANGKVTKTNVTINQLYTTATAQEKAEVPLANEEKRAAGAAKGDVAMQTGDAYLGTRNYPKAVELYRLALQKGSVDANVVNTRLGIALALSGQKAEAKTAFGAVTGSPRGEIAKFWTTWLDLPLA